MANIRGKWEGNVTFKTFTFVVLRYFCHSPQFFLKKFQRFWLF